MYSIQNNDAGSNGSYHGADDSQWASRSDRRSRHVMVLLSVLVLALHALILIWLAGPKPRAIQQKPVIIEVSLLPEPAPPAVEQSTPAPAPAPALADRTPPKKIKTPKPVAKEPPKKTRPQPKKQAELPKPVVEKADESLAKLVEEARSMHFETFQPQTNTAKTSKPAPPNTASNATKATNPGKSKAVERAACVSCPEPDYPALARRRGWQGSVVLKFQLTTDGSAQNIIVFRSSGHPQLDQAAIDNAKESRFTRGEPGVIRTATKQYNFRLNS